MSHAKLEITKRKHEEQVWNVLKMHLMMIDIQKLMDKSENKNMTKATATCVSYLGKTQKRSFGRKSTTYS